MWIEGEKIRYKRKRQWFDGEYVGPDPDRKGYHTIISLPGGTCIYSIHGSCIRT